ncbi:MAG: alpha/beta hydrolase [Chloroflexota bacterium]
MSQAHLTFPCGPLTLEGIWHRPPGGGPFPAVIVSHPHPLYGGDMANSVVFAICQALEKQAIATLRFNFRGVGDSQGSFGGGIAEQDDVRAALAFVRAAPEVDRARIGLAGYSFGASVVAPVAREDEGVSRLALVSPALSEAGWQQLKDYTRPKLLIVGDGDFIVPLADFERYTAALPEPRQVRVVAGADHFWLGHQDEMADQVSGFFTSGFTTPHSA